MAEFQFTKPGLNSVGQYQQSGIPYISSSWYITSDVTGVVEVEFPTVTKFVTIINQHSGSDAPLRVGFSSLGVTLNNHCFILHNGESYTGEFRVSKMYLLGDGVNSTASVIAGLTNIELENLPNNWSGSDSIYNDGIG